MKFRITQSPLVDELNIRTQTFIDLLTKEEKDAIAEYSLGRYLTINRALRNDKILNDVPLIDSTLNKFTFDKTIKVYRKLFIVNDNFINYINYIKEHGYILDKAYQSTSLNKFTFVTEHNIFLEIDIDNHSHGAYISPLCEIPMEQEYLIKRNTKIEVEDMSEESEFGCVYIKGRVK